MPDFSFLDYLAFTLYVGAWLGYSLYADHSVARRRSVSISINHFRHKWMDQMANREVRLVDTQIISHLTTGVSFFSSTTILVLAGLIGLLGETEAALAGLAAIPFADQTTAEVWQFKVLVLIVIMIYAFFKFAWSFRLINFCSILIGATCDLDQPQAERQKTAAKAARMNMLAGQSLDLGLRAYFFALALLGWFLHPALLIFSTLIVVWVMYSRRFRSRALQILEHKPGATSPQLLDILYRGGLRLVRKLRKKHKNKQ